MRESGGGRVFMVGFWNGFCKCNEFIDLFSNENR